MQVNWGGVSNRHLNLGEGVSFDIDVPQVLHFCEEIGDEFAVLGLGEVARVVKAMDVGLADTFRRNHETNLCFGGPGIARLHFDVLAGAEHSIVLPIFFDEIEKSVGFILRKEIFDSPDAGVRRQQLCFVCDWGRPRLGGVQRRIFCRRSS